MGNGLTNTKEGMACYAHNRQQNELLDFFAVWKKHALYWNSMSLAEPMEFVK